MKAKQIRIYSFNRKNISDNQITSDDLSTNLVSISESFFTKAYECYKDETLQEGQLIDEIIKVLLPNSEDKAKKEWTEGLTFNEHKYFAWLATPSGMKTETLSGKCETLFIREDFRAFASEFEDLISLGKFKEIEESKEEICINKDILSRISLGLSSSQAAGEMPNIIVLPQPKHRITKDYKTVQKSTPQIEDKKGELNDVVDYELVAYPFDGDIDVFDGGGIATPQVFSQIKKELELNYPAEFAIIRGYGIGIKGMITKFDILKYLNAVYRNDTEYCRKAEEKFYLFDYWNEWQEVTENTMLLNESMVKLAKYYSQDNDENLNAYKERLTQVDSKFKDIIGKLYVTKVNKKDEEIKEYSRLNYQLLTALALSKKDYYELIAEDIRSYAKIVKPFSKDSKESEWTKSLDNIRIFFNCIVNTDDLESDEFEQEVQIHNMSIMTKCEELLHISEDFIDLKNVRRSLGGQIEKRCRELACGKITTKAIYKYIAVDPVSYLNYAIYRQQGDNGLKEGEFYSSDYDNGDIRTIARNPLCAYSEVHNVKFVRNPFMDNYLSPCRELIYCNQKSDILSLMSSADCDGDGCIVVNNDIIRDAVVSPQDGKYFLNKDDGHKEKMEFNAENRFLATYRASGNLIGKIALKSANINSQSQQTLNYYDTKNECFVKFNSNKATTEEIESKNQKIETGEWMTTYNASEQHKDHIRQRFLDNEKDIYIVLYNAMVSIDAPKTLFFPSLDDMKMINKKYPLKAWFLRYKENKEETSAQGYLWTDGLLDVMTHLVEDRLLSKIDKVSFKDNVSLIQEKLVNGDYPPEEFSPCAEEIQALYEAYKNERSIIDKTYNRLKGKEQRDKELLIDAGYWHQAEENIYLDNIKKYKQQRNQKYRETDVTFNLLTDGIFNRYQLATIANALGCMKNSTEDFIINLFWPVFEYLNAKLQPKRYFYKKSDDGDISFLHEKYKKIEVPAVDNNSIIKHIDLLEKSRLKIIDPVTVRARLINDSAIKIIESELKIVGFIWLDVEIENEEIFLAYNGVPLLKPFADSSQINEYNISMLEKVKVKLLESKNKKSIGMIITEIKSK